MSPRKPSTPAKKTVTPQTSEGQVTQQEQARTKLTLAGSAKRSQKKPECRPKPAMSAHTHHDDTEDMLAQILRALFAELFGQEAVGEAPLLVEEIKKPEILKNRVELLLKVLERLEKSRKETPVKSTPMVHLEWVDAAKKGR